MRASEQLQPGERKRTLAISEMTFPLSITEADVNRVSLERVKMLASIESYLSTAQREAIQKKLEKEKEMMFEIVGTEKKIQGAPKKSFLSLDQTYFKHKTIDNSVFE